MIEVIARLILNRSVRLKDGSVVTVEFVLDDGSARTDRGVYFPLSDIEGLS